MSPLSPTDESAFLAGFIFKSLNGERMPSMAEDVATERTKLLSRSTGLRK